MRREVATTTAIQTSAARCTSGITAICCTSGARRRRSSASETSRPIGAASQARMGGIDVSLIATPILISRNKTQLRCPLPTYCRGHLRAESRSLAPECSHCIDDRKARRDNHVHQKVPAIWGRKNLLDEKIVDAIANVAIREREVQRPLHLPTELLCLPFGLTVTRRLA